MAVVFKTVGRQNFVYDKRLGGRHQIGVALEGGVGALNGLRRGRAVDIRPVAIHLRLHGAIAQQGQRVLQVLVQGGVVFDHGLDAGESRDGGAQGPQAVALVTAPGQQAQGHRRVQQALQGGLAHLGLLGQGPQGLWLLDALKNRQPHTGQQHLGVDKAGHQVKHLLRAALGDPARQGVADAPAVKLLAGEAAVQPFVCQFAPGGT